MTRQPGHRVGRSKSRSIQRERRHRRVRKKIWGTEQRPRLVVHRSLNNVEGQLVDDDAGRTLHGISTLSPEVRGAQTAGGDGEAGNEGDPRKVAAARAAGRHLAQLAREAGIESVVFDRGGYKYHGRVKAFAEGAREGGLEF